MEYEDLKKEFEKLSFKKRWAIIEPYLGDNVFVEHPNKPIGVCCKTISPYIALQKAIILKPNLLFSRSGGTNKSFCFSGEGRRLKDNGDMFFMKLVVLKKEWAKMIKALGYEDEPKYIGINDCIILLKRKLVLEEE